VHSKLPSEHYISRRHTEDVGGSSHEAIQQGLQATEIVHVTNGSSSTAVPPIEHHLTPTGHYVTSEQNGTVTNPEDANRTSRPASSNSSLPIPSGALVPHSNITMANPTVAVQNDTRGKMTTGTKDSITLEIPNDRRVSSSSACSLNSLLWLSKPFAFSHFFHVSV
jgi:hypothetical protein